MPHTEPAPTDPAPTEQAPTPTGLDALVRRILALSDAAGRRVIVGITGSPGAGKSTLAEALAASVDAARGAGTAVHVPMDGYHLANATLDRLALRHRKGAIETFDGWGFVSLLERVRHEPDHTVYAPGFERSLDEPVAGEIAIEASARVVIVEGNYLLGDEEPWVRVHDLLDEAWFCDADDDERMRRLVGRHVAGGRSVDDATAWATEVDGANARRIAPSHEGADLVVSGVTWEVVAGPDGGRE